MNPFRSRGLSSGCLCPEPPVITLPHPPFFFHESPFLVTPTMVRYSNIISFSAVTGEELIDLRFFYRGVVGLYACTACP